MNDTLAWDLTGKNDPSECIDIDPDYLYSLERRERRESILICTLTEDHGKV